MRNSSDLFARFNLMSLHLILLLAIQRFLPFDPEFAVNASFKFKRYYIAEGTSQLPFKVLLLYKEISSFN